MSLGGDDRRAVVVAELVDEGVAGAFLVCGGVGATPDLMHKMILGLKDVLGNGKVS